jgi:hypothetical protein
MTKVFTVEEANALLPQVRHLIEEIFALRQEVMGMRPDMRPVLEKAVGNGGSRKAGELLETFKKFEQVIAQLHRLGCELKGIEQGLVDFPAIRDGQLVYLCWQYNEPVVAFWHDIDAGFAGRQPL